MNHIRHEHPFAKQMNYSNNPNGQAHNQANNMTNNMGRSSISATPLHAGPSTEELTRIFNSALVATRVAESKNPASELHALMETPAFQAMMNSVRHLARSEGISEREAAELLVQTFRKVDQIWADYIYQEGVNRLRNPKGSRD